MPVRRSSASAAGSPAQLGSSTRSRDHTSHLYGNSDVNSVLGRPEGSGGGEQKVISTLVGRLVNKLPCNSGTRLGVMEVDGGITSTVQALLQISSIQMGGVVHALVAALESLAKFFASSNHVSVQEIPLEILQSQIYLLDILSRCLSRQWYLHTNKSSQSPTPLPRLWPDPAPLDDSLAKYLLSILLLYIRLVSVESTPVPGTGSPAPSRETRNVGTVSATSWNRSMSSTGTSGGLDVEYLERHSISPGSTSPKQPPDLPKLAGSCDTPHACTTQMTNLVARITFHLSASNWHVIFARVKSRISYLTTTIDESPDCTDLRLLEWANVNRPRLSQILQEASTSFLHIKRPAQVVMATMLRRAIWTFIDAHPLEFEGVIQSERKIEGGAEVLFDILYSMSDIASSSALRRTKVFYPLMAMLLVLCPDILKRIAMGDMGAKSSSVMAKKRSFLDTLRKGLGTSKGFEACIVCYVDLVSAASCVSPALESSGVRSLVPDIQGDLKTALLSPQSKDEIGNTSIIVHGLSALFQIDPTTISTSTLPMLLGDKNELNQLIGLKTLDSITSRRQRLPWYPQLASLRHDTSPLVQKLLQSLFKTVIGDTSRRPRASPELPASQSDLIVEILKLYGIDPAYILERSTDVAAQNQALNTISALMVSPSPEFVRSAAANTCCSVLHHIALESNNVDPKVVVAITDSLWKMELDVHRQLLHVIQSVDLYDVNDAFIAARDLSSALVQAAEAYPEAFASTSTGNSAALVAFVAIVSQLCSPDFEHVSVTIPAMKMLSQITSITYQLALPGASPGDTNFGDPAKRIEARMNLLRDLGAVPPALGRQQQQRQLRQIYKPYCLPSTAGMAIWTGLAQVAKVLTSKIIAADVDSTAPYARRRGLATDIEGLDDGQSKLWQNIIMFLLATSTICAYDGVAPPPLVDTVGKGILPSIFDDPTDAKAMCEQFVRDCVDLLASPSIHVRETLKEGLGSELPLYWAKTMISQMVKILSHSIASTGISVSEPFTIFVDQILIILRLTVDRLRPVENGTPTQIDLAPLLSLLAQYLPKLGRDPDSTRIKMRFCQLVEVALFKSDITMTSNAVNLKNAVFEVLIDWSGETPADRDAHRFNQSEGSKIHRDLERAALKAMVPITDRLSIKTAEDGGKSDGPMQSRLFYKYFHHLIRVLERSHLTDLASIDSPATSTTVVRPGFNLSPDEPPALVVLIVSNLLAANMDVGLKHCLGLGYHEDHSLRVVFMQIMSNILRSGNFGGLSSKRISSTPRAYLGALAGNNSNLTLAVAVCETCPPSEIDEMSMLLFRVFEAKGSILGLLKVLTEREVAMTNHEPDLFRANSITTRILTIFGKTYGYNYVRATIQPLIHSLLEKPAETSFELDPAKALPNDDIERNADHLQAVCQALLHLICGSAPKAPVIFRVLCHYLWSAVEVKFPDSRHSIVGSFIFLRFFCPAIVAPDQIDLDVSPDAKEVRRALLLITKVIQNLASNVMFGNKEPHMKVLNPFLERNIHVVTKFLSNIAVRPRSYEIALAVKESQEEAARAVDPEGDEAILHRFVYKHRAKLESALDAMPPSFARPSADKPLSGRGELEGKTALHTIREIIDETGPPPHSTMLSPAARTQAYDDFVKHNAGRSTEAVANAFYEGPASQNGRRIFYFVVGRISVMDYDLLAYHIFTILDKITDFFDLVIDLTDYNQSSELPMTWLKRTVQLCPPGILPCIHTLALYNPNTFARKRIRGLISELLLVIPPAGKNIVAVSSPAELAEFIPFTSLALPEGTMILAYEAEHVFTNLLCLLDHEKQVPVVVKLGHDCMQVASWRKQDLTPAVKSYIIDVIRLKDIDDVITGGTLPADYLVIKYHQTESVTFISRKRTEMAQIIRAARSRLRDTLSSNRTLKSSDAPGTLLNVAMLNLAASDEILRLGAYNLINELSLFYKWDAPAAQLRASIGLAIPGNSLAFNQELSRSLATAASHLTLEFLKEWTIGFSKAEITQKIASLQYVQPWLANLDTFSRPSRETGIESIKQIEEIVRSLAAITVAERRRLHLALQENVWTVLHNSHESLTDIVVAELLHMATDAGLGSEKTECAADILVSMGSTIVRGKVIARLRKALAATYLKPNTRLPDHLSWNEISTLSRVLLMLSFNTKSYLTTQLFLPEVLHIVTILLGSGPLLIRQTMYSITMNTILSLVSSAPTGDMDSGALQELHAHLSTPGMIKAFGLSSSPHSMEMSGLSEKEVAGAMLDSVELVSKFFGDVLSAGAISTDCANVWRARWMGLVASTCFQHNPASQPQAFTVLGHLACDEVDDDLVYQILVALGSSLQHLTENDNLLVTSMLHCLARIVPGLLPTSRYPICLFWLSVGVLQLGYIPLFGAALELFVAALGTVSDSVTLGPMTELLMEGRPEDESCRKLDQIAGVSFGTDVAFSLVAIVFKGVRHPSTRKSTIDAMLLLLKLSSKSPAQAEAKGMVSEGGVPFFMALLPVLSSSPDELGGLWKAAALEGPASGDLNNIAMLNILHIPDNSTALLLIALAVTTLSFSSSESEKLILYRFLAEAAVEMPEVMAMIYDTLIPRMTATLSTTSSIPILNAMTTILERAMSDPNYTFPPSISASESTSSLHLHTKSYAQSISSAPSIGQSQRDQVLDDLGMRGIGELTFQIMKMDHVASMAKWVASLIESFTV